jgi:short-subunit dehydrogenase|tara:strand:+ start:138 stop:971 length:834 start_codon:yes stop_codon:yes gene_type:complete
MDNFSGKNVLITGASSGIGLAMAKDFANRGANLILTARSEDKLMQLAKDLSGKGIKTHVFIEDISLPNSAQKLFNQVNAAELEVDVLVNNAGYGRWGNFDECPMEDYENMVHLNVTSLTELSYLFVDQMVKRGSGGIINVASTAAFFPIPYSAVYAATKAYVLSLSEALNFEYSKKGVHVMAVCPGATESKFINVATENSERLKQRLINVDRVKNKLTTSKIQTAEDCSKEALDAYLKGKIYVITGQNNRNLYTMSRFFSRKTSLNWSGKVFKKIAG